MASSALLKAVVASPAAAPVAAPDLHEEHTHTNNTMVSFEREGSVAPEVALADYVGEVDPVGAKNTASARKAEDARIFFEIRRLRAEHGYSPESDDADGPQPRTQRNAACGRGADFTCSPARAREILGEDCVGNAQQEVPFSESELLSAKGEYILVGVPAMSGVELLDLLAVSNIGVTLAGASLDVDFVGIKPGWFLIRKSGRATGPARLPSFPTTQNVFALLYAAAATFASQGTFPFGGASATTTWEADGETFRLFGLVNSVGSVYLRADVVTPESDGEDVLFL